MEQIKAWLENFFTGADFNTFFDKIIAFVKMIITNEFPKAKDFID